ncbi:MAG: hypothetical protein IPK70_17435 [Flavobacteriales bacterium]|nr:hypothetical protein [Flavobacteriales bacterium]
MAALCGGEGGYGAAFLDVTTGEFLVAEEGAEAMAKLIDGHAPRELLFPKGRSDGFMDAQAGRTYGYALDDWAFADEFARERLLGPLRDGFTQGLRHRGPAPGATCRRRRAALLGRNAQRPHRAHREGVAAASLRSCRPRPLHHPQPRAGGARRRWRPKPAAEHGPLQRHPWAARILKRWILFPSDRSRGH